MARFFYYLPGGYFGVFMRNIGSCFLLTGFLSLTNIPCSAQFLEFGFGGGAITYNGDLNTRFDFSSPSVGGSFLSRFNISNTLSTRLGLLVGQINGNDNRAQDILGTRRSARFSARMGEVSGCVEYYFVDYQSQYDQLRLSPYLFVGAGLFTYSASTTGNALFFEPNIPFGIGLRKLLNKNHTTALGIEFGARKTFTDRLDNISGGQSTVKNFQYGNRYDSDWFHYLGVSFSFITYPVRCRYREHY